MGKSGSTQRLFSTLPALPCTCFTQTALSQLCGVPDYLLRLTQSLARYNPYVNGSYGVSSAAHFGSSSIPSAHYPPRPSSSIPPYDPYAPPRRPVVPPAATASTSSAPGRPFMEHAMHSLMSFQPYSSSILLFSAWIGPSLLLLNAPVCAYISVTISRVYALHSESTSQMDRRSQSLTFSITNDIVTKLESKRSVVIFPLRNLSSPRLALNINYGCIAHRRHIIPLQRPFDLLLDLALSNFHLPVKSVSTPMR